MKKSIGLSLSGGGARALIYLGVIKALEENDISISVIGGLSGGAIIAGLYASGLSVEDIQDIALNLKIFSILDTNPFDGVEIIDHNKFKSLLQKFAKKESIEDTNIKLLIFATDLKTKQTKVFKKGPLVDAIVASCSLPPVLSAYEFNNTQYIDGGYSIMYGANYFRDLGCDTVIGADVDGFATSGLPTFFKSIVDSVVTLVAINGRNEKKNNPVDLELKGFKAAVGMFEFTRLSQDLIDAGYKKTKRYIPKIKKLLNIV